MTDNGDGTKTIACEDGTTATVSDGTSGSDGTSCTVVDNGDGTKTITCEDGTEVTVSDGDPGLDSGMSPGLVITMSTSAPANGTHFVAGEQIVVFIDLEDGLGNQLELDDLSRASLYMNGPRDVLKTVTASALLNTNTDRATSPHHYIDLKDETNPNQVVVGNQVQYTLEPITAEEAGTYTIGLWSLLDGYPYDQAFAFTDVQIGTATEESWTVGNCADCHQGAASGMIYLHHIDPGYSPTGNWSLDFEPVRSCKNCHNQDGYAAVRKCDDGSKPVSLGGGVYQCEDGTENWSYMVDPIVRRVHGVHMGKDLRSRFNTDSDWGDFGHYTEVHFPADPKNCTKCHLNDAWKEKPSRLACGSCHDDLDFGTGTYDPPKIGGDCTVDADCVAEFGTNATCNAEDKCELAVHGGLAQSDDSMCTTCHTATEGVGLAPIPDAHAAPTYNFGYTVNLQMNTPANGSYYVDGEAPVLTVTIRDLSGNPVDPNTITDLNHARGNVFFSGPREHTHPVLSTAAKGVEAIRAETACANQPYDFSSAVNFQVNIDGAGVITIPVADGTFADTSAVTTNEAVAWLNANASFSALATASPDVNAYYGTDRVKIKSNSRGTGSSVEILASGATTAMGWVEGTYVPVDTHYYANNDFRVRTDPFDEDPKITRMSTNFTYQLDPIGGHAPGTYSIWLEIGAAPPMSWALLNFQVGTDVEEPKVATNCLNCHEDTRMHAGYFAINFEPDICKSCHDYERQQEGMLGWAGAGPNMGFGAAPLARRIHGVHYGHYLDKPEEIHASYDYSHVIFPQDIRNCTTCHSETDAWTEEPSRLACLACHDSDAAIAHGTLMTLDPTPDDPWNGDEQESCEACHGKGHEFAPSVVHNIWDPYQAPYPREAEGH